MRAITNAGFRMRDHVMSWEETSMYTDPPANGYIILSSIGIALIVIVTMTGLLIYGS